jgi:hypothetical protein
VIRIVAYELVGINRTNRPRTSRQLQDSRQRESRFKSTPVASSVGTIGGGLGTVRVGLSDVDGVPSYGATSNDLWSVRHLTVAHENAARLTNPSQLPEYRYIGLVNTGAAFLSTVMHRPRSKTAPNETLNERSSSSFNAHESSCRRVLNRHASGVSLLGERQRVALDVECIHFVCARFHDHRYLRDDRPDRDGIARDIVSSGVRRHRSPHCAKFVGRRFAGVIDLRSIRRGEHYAVVLAGEDVHAGYGLTSEVHHLPDTLEWVIRRGVRDPGMRGKQEQPSE